jgi:hypothetical protein
VKVVAEFAPPDAQGQYRAWRVRHADALAAIPDDEVRVDVGWANPGDFVRVWIADRHSDGFGESVEPTV